MMRDLNTRCVKNVKKNTLKVRTIMIIIMVLNSNLISIAFIIDLIKHEQTGKGHAVLRFIIMITSNHRTIFIHNLGHEASIAFNLTSLHINV